MVNERKKNTFLRKNSWKVLNFFISLQRERKRFPPAEMKE